MFKSKNIDQKSKLVLNAVYVSIITAVIILIAKLFAWYLTDSSIVLASFIDSLLDIMASFFNYIAAWYASSPPNSRYRFGYGRAEDLAVFIQSSLFGISGVIILIQAIKKIVFPSEIENEGGAIWLMLFSIVMTLVLLFYQRSVIRRTGSKIVKFDSFHYSTDLFTNIMVIVALYLHKAFDIYIVDPICAGALGLYMIYGGVRLVRSTFSNLMDHEFDDSEKDKLHKIILAHKDVKGYHDLKTRHAGQKSFIQLHLELDGNISLNKAHQIAEEVDMMIRKEFKDVDVIIHQDPEDVMEKRQFYD